MWRWNSATYLLKLLSDRHLKDITLTIIYLWRSKASCIRTYRTSYIYLNKMSKNNALRQNRSPPLPTIFGYSLNGEIANLNYGLMASRCPDNIPIQNNNFVKGTGIEPVLTLYQWAIPSKTCEPRGWQENVWMYIHYHCMWFPRWGWEKIKWYNDLTKIYPILM